MYFGGNQFEYPRDSMNEIEEGLFLGDINAVENADFLRSKNITKVVSLLEYFPSYSTFEGIDYHQIAIEDAAYSNLLKFVPEAIRFISNAKKNGHNVLVHCAAGISRSSSLVIAYIMVKYNKTYNEARDLVNQKRRGICPNLGFVRQLQSIEIDQYKEFL